jgi:nicotinamidase-related amidase
VLANAMLLARLARLFGVPVTGTEQTPDKLGPLPHGLRALCDTVVVKTHFDACGDGLREQLAAGRPQLVVAGCETHVCLLQTTLALLRAGHEVWLVTDACGSRSPTNRELALQRLAGAGARLVGTEMVAFEWTRDARDARLRDVLALVK